MKKYLLTLCFALFMTACTDEVSFSPQTGQSRAYWIRTVSLLDHQAHRSVDAYMDYRVEQGNPDPKVHVSPLFVVQQSPQAQTIFSTTRHYAVTSPFYARAALYHDGFDVQFKTNTSLDKTLQPRNLVAWQQVLTHQDAWSVLLLHDLLQAPALNQTVPAIVGKQVKLNLMSSHPVTLRVTHVTDHTVSGVIEQVTKPNEAAYPQRIYGEIQLSRKTGWIRTLVLYSMGSLFIKGQSHTVEMLTTMDRVDHTRTEMSLQVDEPRLHRARPHPIQTKLPDALSHHLADSAPFPLRKGIFQVVSPDAVSLSVLNEPHHYPYRGQVQLTKIQGYDRQGQRLPVSLVAEQTLAATVHADNGMNISVHKVIPGAEVSLPGLTQSIASVRAVAVYYADKVIPHTIHWKSGQRQILTLPGLHVVITPVPGSAHDYRLAFNDTARHLLLPYFPGLSGTFTEHAATGLPDWVSEPARAVFDRISIYPHRHEYLLHLSHEPVRVTLYEYRLSPKPSVHQNMTFVPYPAFLQDASLPVVHDVPLYPPDQFDFIRFDPHHLNFEGDSKQSATVTLPVEWARVCQFRVLSAMRINGHAFKWLSTAATERNHRFSLVKAFHLTTDDGIRRYFYDKSVQSQLRCRQQPEWTPVPFTSLAHHPWFVPLTTFPIVDLTVPVDQFALRYRFYNAKHQVIALLDKNGTVAVGKKLVLKDIVVDHQYLRLGGDIVKIEKLTMNDRPLHVEWTNRFPPLP